MISRDKVLDFIGDLVYQKDPFVFAGYGSDYQNEYTKAIVSEDSIECFDVKEKFIS